MSRFLFWLVLGYWWLCVCPASAQRQKLIDGPGVWSIGVGLGGTYYIGDLRPRIGQGQLRIDPALSASVSYQAFNHVQFRGELCYARVAGSQISTDNRANNLSFITANPEIRLGALLFLLPTVDQPKWNPFLSAGVGLTYLSPKADYNDQLVDLAPLHTEGVAYTRLVGLTTLSIGVTRRLSPKYQLYLELSDTFILSDYFDDVSTIYVDPSQLSSSLAVALADRSPESGYLPKTPGTARGNPNNNDSYLMIGVRVSRFLNSHIGVKEKARMRCPSF